MNDEEQIAESKLSTISESSSDESDNNDDKEEEQQQQVPGGGEVYNNIIEHEIDINPNHLRYKTKHLNRFDGKVEAATTTSDENAEAKSKNDITTNIELNVYLDEATRMPTSNYRHVEIESKTNKLGGLESSNIRQQIGGGPHDSLKGSTNRGVTRLPNKLIIESDGQQMKDDNSSSSPHVLIQTEFNRETKFEQEREAMRKELITPLLDNSDYFVLKRRDDLSLTRLLAMAVLATIIFCLTCYILLPFVVNWPNDCKLSNDILFINQKPRDQDQPLAF